MAEEVKILCNRSEIVNIADKVRSKTGLTNEMTLKEIAQGVEDIETGIDTSDATALVDEVFAGKTAYLADGKVTGTFTIDDELSEQNNLISQISTLVATKATPSGGEDVTAETNDYTTKIASLETAVTALENELAGKASGGSGSGSIETCTVTIFTLSPDLYIAGTLVNADGSVTGVMEPVFSEEQCTYNVLKNSVVTFISRSWSTNFADSSLDFNGYEILALECQGAVMCLHLTGDAVALSFIAS